MPKATPCRSSSIFLCPCVPSSAIRFSAVGDVPPRDAAGRVVDFPATVLPRAATPFTNSKPTTKPSPGPPRRFPACRLAAKRAYAHLLIFLVLRSWLISRSTISRLPFRHQILLPAGPVSLARSRLASCRHAGQSSCSPGCSSSRSRLASPIRPRHSRLPRFPAGASLC